MRALVELQRAIAWFADEKTEQDKSMFVDAARLATLP